jgi:hypothetical protein
LQSARKAEETPQARALIHVAFRNGRWQVTESGPRNAVSCFGERRDAMEYASSLAGRLQSDFAVGDDEDDERDASSRS